MPISARLMTVADMYDALRSKRCYKPALPHRQAVEMIHAARGKDFDPDVVDAFLEIQDELRAIAERFVDGGGNAHPPEAT